MREPEENTQLTPADDTIISVPPVPDDTVISDVDEATIVDSVVIEETIVGDDKTLVGVDHTIIPTDETQIPSTTENFPTLIGTLLEDVVDSNEHNQIEPDTGPTQTTPAHHLRDSTGAIFSLASPLVIGRRPSAARSALTQVKLVIAPSPQGTISASHARIEQLGQVIVITDLGSTNGTRVSVPGHRTRLLGPGESTTLTMGATVELGDSYRLEVLD